MSALYRDGLSVSNRYLQRIVLALGEGDTQRACEVVEDLLAWLDRGGPPPTHREQVAAGLLCTPSNLRAVLRAWRDLTP